MNTAFRLSLLPYPIALVVAVIMAVHVYSRPQPTVYRSTWCPPPEIREVADRSLTRVQVLARLREIRTKFADLHGPELYEAADDAPGSVAELDRLMLTLISDYDLATTPTEGAKP